MIEADRKDEEVKQEENVRKSRKKRSAGLFLGGAVAGALLMAAGLNVLSSGMLFSKGLLSGQTVRKVNVLKQLIDQHYYKADEVTDEQLEEGLYKGLLESLDDPYSVYYTPDEVEKLNETISGTYTGIGAYVSKDASTGCPKIAGVISGAPAETVGLQTDDILLEADGESLQDLDLDMAVSRIRGEKGTTVHLTISRDGKKQEVDVMREEVHSETAAGEMLEDGIGYLQIAEFDDVTPDQFTEELKKLQDQGMKGLILDLRNNPGGTVEAVTSVAQYLIPEGLVFYMQYPDGSRKEYKADGTDWINLPTAVLVNGNSASASEILSSAIQDSGAGTIIGTQTYGKGVVQTVYSLQDGTEVKLTISEYFTRNGHEINKIGVTPDQTVEFDSEEYQKSGTDNQLETAIETITEKIK